MMSDVIHIVPRGGRYKVDSKGREIYLKAADLGWLGLDDRVISSDHCGHRWNAGLPASESLEF